jgi:hypothetical protein
LYSNENFPFPVVAELRQWGHDVMTIQEAGSGNEAAPDDEVLRLATADQRADLTHNRRDFIALHNRVPRLTLRNVDGGFLLATAVACLTY